MKSIEEIRRENLRALIEELGMKIYDLTGKSQSQISQWSTGAIRSQTGKPSNISTKSARFLENACGKQEGWLDKDHHNQLESQAKITESNVSESGFTLRLIPIISWVQAGAFVESNVIDETWAVSNYVHATSNVSDKAFALRVEGDSMVSHTGGYSFPDGVIIICDPEQSASVGSFVIAKDTITQGTTFKRLDGDGLVFKLTALNSEKYDPIPINNGNIRIIAKVVDSVQRLP